MTGCGKKGNDVVILAASFVAELGIPTLIESARLFIHSNPLLLLVAPISFALGLIMSPIQLGRGKPKVIKAGKISLAIGVFVPPALILMVIPDPLYLLLMSYLSLRLRNILQVMWGYKTRVRK